MPRDIQFPEGNPRYVFERDCLGFRALVDGKPVECLVTVELLMSRFGARDPSEDSMRQAYQEHKADIQAIAWAHIENGWIDEENRVFLTTRFTRLKVTFGERTAGRSVEAAHRLLTEIIGPNAETIDVTWDVEETPLDRPNISLQIADPSLPYKGKLYLGSKVEQDSTRLPLLLADIWGRVLQARSRKLNLKSG